MINFRKLLCKLGVHNMKITGLYMNHYDEFYYFKECKYCEKGKIPKNSRKAFIPSGWQYKDEVK